MPTVFVAVESDVTPFAAHTHEPDWDTHDSTAVAVGAVKLFRTVEAKL
jgi:hypothetical protein